MSRGEVWFFCITLVLWGGCVMTYATMVQVKQPVGVLMCSQLCHKVVGCLNFTYMTSHMSCTVGDQNQTLVGENRKYIFIVLKELDVIRHREDTCPLDSFKLITRTKKTKCFQKCYHVHPTLPSQTYDLQEPEDNETNDGTTEDLQAESHAQPSPVNTLYQPYACQQQVVPQEIEDFQQAVDLPPPPDPPPEIVTPPEESVNGISSHGHRRSQRERKLPRHLGDYELDF